MTISNLYRAVLTDGYITRTHYVVAPSAEDAIAAAETIGLKVSEIESMLPVNVA